MKRVELDYVAAPRFAGWPGIVLLVVSLAVAADLIARYVETRAELARLELASGLAPAERRTLPPLPKERLDAETKDAELVVRQLSLPWGALIHEIERSATREVAVLQLQPDADTKSFRLTAEARSREAMFDYLRRLSAAQVLGDVHIVSHQVQRDDPQRPIVFSLQAALRTGGGSGR